MISATFTGQEDIDTALDDVKESLLSAVEAWIADHMEELKVASQDIVPVDTSKLHDSATTGIETEGEVVTGGVGYSAENEGFEYSIVQHEDLHYHHDPGQQAKYLEQPMNELSTEWESSLGEALGGVV